MIREKSNPDEPTPPLVVLEGAKKEDTPKTAQPTKRWNILGGVMALIPVLAFAYLIAYFLDQAQFSETYHSKSIGLPFQWKGQWITVPDKTSAFTLRKSFYLHDNISSAYIAVSAENFFELRVNGRKATPYFTPANDTSAYVDGVNETPNTEIGNTQSSHLAVICSIGQFLKAGKNDITVQVQSDRGTPKIILQAKIKPFSSDPILLTTDSSWKYSLAPNMDNFYWTSPYYDDSHWANVVTTSGPLNLPVDGNPALFTQMPFASYIGGPTTTLSQVVTFKKTFRWNQTVSRGWLRVSSALPYDLLLNGQPIGSTSDPVNSSPLFSRQRNVDFLARSRTANAGTRREGQTVSAPCDAYILTNALRRGENSIQITLQDQAARDLRTQPSVYLDGTIWDNRDHYYKIATDSSWKARVIGVGQTDWTPARIESTPIRRQGGRMFPHIIGNIFPRSDLFGRVTANALLVFAALLLIGYGVAERMRYLPNSGINLAQRIGAQFLIPAVVLGCLAVLEAIFVFSPQYLIVGSPKYAIIAIGIGILAYITVVLVAFFNQPKSDKEIAIVAAADPLKARNWPAFADKFGAAIAVGILMAVSGFLATHAINVNPFLNDEYVSILCSRGIVRHGIPIYEVSGVIYGRSALFHYLLAPFVAWGYAVHNLGVTRYLSAIWQLALIPLGYIFGRELKGRKAGLISAAVIALSPYLLFYARETRFYEQFAFFSTLTFYLQYRAIKNPDRPWYRVGTLLAFAGSYHSQELALSMVPALIAIVFITKQEKLWFSKWSLLTAGLVSLSIFADLYVYFKYCTTPLPYMDREAMPLLALHTDDMETLPSMVFVNYDRLQLPAFLLFFGGMSYAIYKGLKPNDGKHEPGYMSWYSYMYVSTLISLVTLCALLPVGGARYTISVVPPVLIVCACVSVVMAQSIFRWLRDATASLNVARLGRFAFGMALALTVLVAYRPLRIYNSTERMLNRDHTGAAQYVAAHALPGDKMLFFNPQAALVEVGRCEYYWTTPRKSLYKYIARDGRLRERDSGALVIDDKDKLKDIMVQNRRIWLVITSLAPGRVGQSGFVAQNFRLQHQSYGMQVWLWDRDRNSYNYSSPSMGYDQLNF